MQGPDNAAHIPPPPPEYGTVIRLDDPIGSGTAPTNRRPIAAVIGVAAGVAVLAAAATWLALSASPDVDDEPAVAAAVVAPSEPASPAVAAAAPAPTCPAGMVEIAGGGYFMGSDDVDQPVLRSARPAHKVEVASFCIDIHEVSVSEYRTCSDRGQCKRAHRDSMWPQGKQDDEGWSADRKTYSALCNEGIEGHGDHPVNCVSWHQAKAFCESRDARLPTEAEWEFAARGSDGRVYSWGDAAPDSEHMNGCGSECVAWRDSVELSETPSLHASDDGFIGTAPVGSFPAGKAQAGLFDMAGNVFEWTASEFVPFDEAQRLAEAAAAAPDAPTKRVIRGGAFNSFMPVFADPALRFGQAEDAHPHAIGFRCAAGTEAN